MHRHPPASIDAEHALIDQVDALLPQTQCGQCTFNGCRPYAAAIVRGEADINQCPPGGHATAANLAALLGRPVKPVDEKYGDPFAPVLVAYIHEELCIGCARCLPPCPVDAIIGAARYTHTVITADCTGCKLCIAPCPVDCIEMRPPESPRQDSEAGARASRDLARARYVAHTERLAADQAERQRKLQARRPGPRP
ncbi:MAG: RnfABCDGE type electron transport complex subunit B [Steroidobacteraceae bacterium]